MEKTETLRTEIGQYDFPVNLVKLLNVVFDDRDYQKMHNARLSLVRMGKTIIPQLHKLVKSENSQIRLEGAKLIQIAADRRSVPVLIFLLDDKEYDIRWIAAEGLIRIGRKSIVPMLKAVSGGKTTLFSNQRVHQVLSSLLSEEEKNKLESLMQSLEDYHGLNETAPVEALRALKILTLKTV
jgi:HEAT repeat protein